MSNKVPGDAHAAVALHTHTLCSKNIYPAQSHPPHRMLKRVVQGLVKAPAWRQHLLELGCCPPEYGICTEPMAYKWCGVPRDKGVEEVGLASLSTSWTFWGLLASGLQQRKK